MENLDAIFNPRSIAVVGASPDPNKMGYHFIRSILSGGYRGQLYPVSSGAAGQTVLGLQVYASLADVPGPVDLVIVSIPRTAVLSLLDECAGKKVKAVHFFTAGFHELGDEMGESLEPQMVQKAHAGGFRIIGPNCLGIYSPPARLAIGAMGKVGKPGRVAFVNQSGGISDKLSLIGIGRDINFSKGVSFGNGIDLDAADFIEYLTADPATGVIGCYVEGTRNGRRFFEVLKKAAAVKPVVVWKGGITEAGARSASSHTGALSTPGNVWSAVLQQAGVAQAFSFEEYADLLMLFQDWVQFPGRNVALLTGVLGGGGGAAVSGSDACVRAGLNVVPLHSETMTVLGDILGRVGSILQNPVDMSQAVGRTPLLEKCFKSVAADPGVQQIIVQEEIDVVVSAYPLEAALEFNRFVRDQLLASGKPFVMVLPPGDAEPARLAVQQVFRDSGVPVFPSLDRAARALSIAAQYGERHPAKSA